MQMPGGVPGGGMVRVGIERDISYHANTKDFHSHSNYFFFIDLCDESIMT